MHSGEQEDLEKRRDCDTLGEVKELYEKAADGWAAPGFPRAGCDLSEISLAIAYMIRHGVSELAMHPDAGI